MYNMLAIALTLVLFEETQTLRACSKDSVAPSTLEERLHSPEPHESSTLLNHQERVGQLSAVGKIGNTNSHSIILCVLTLGYLYS